MANKLYSVPAVLASAVADTGTVTVAYPSGTTQATFTGTKASANAQVVINSNEVYKEAASKCSFSYGASNITVTNSSGVSWPAGASVVFGPCALAGNIGFPVAGTAPADLTAATGTASNTIADVGASFSQTTLNNNFKSLSDKVNAMLAAMRAANIVQ